MMLDAISAEVVRMPNGSNHHLLRCTPIRPPARRAAYALLGPYKAVHVTQNAGGRSRLVANLTPRILETRIRSRPSLPP